MNWNEYFDMMVDWKKLPAYKAEPRIDSLLGYFLKPILCEYLQVNIEEIIPEVPIRLGTVHPHHEGTNYSDRSYKVDFFAIGSNGINYLVEFKTDTNSRRDKQDDYLLRSVHLGTQKVLEGILRIDSVSNYKTKYGHLKAKLQSAGLLDSNMNYSGKNKDFKIIYIQPNNKNNESSVIDFEWVANWFEKKSESDEFEIQFAKALRRWTID